MFQLIVLSVVLMCVSAHYYQDYNHGYNKFFPGLQKGGIHPYQHNNYGYGYGYGIYHQRPYYRQIVVKHLPPIYKDVKQPVIYKQPVIIRKIPVIHKKKEVTVKNLPPVYDEGKKTVIEKDLDVGGKPMVEYMPKEMLTPGMGPDVNYDDKMKMIGKPGVGYEDEYDLDQGMGGKGMVDMNDVMPKEMMMKAMGPEDGVEDEGNQDYSEK